MSGIAVFSQLNSQGVEQESAFQGFLKLVAQYKHLAGPVESAWGQHCWAAKFDSPSTLLPGLVRDKQTGSWALAAGTLVNTIAESNSNTQLEHLLLDYLENGPAALQPYDGHFALVIYHAPEKSLSIISDPLGLFSIFWGRAGDQIYLSTSALAVAKQIQARPDALTIECFLRTGRVYGDKTLWSEVSRLPAAMILKITPQRVELSNYWQPSVDPSITRLPFAEALQQADHLLTRTFKAALQGEQKVWADLTGGFDSRLSAALLTRSAIPFIANCVGPEGDPDVEISQMVSQKMRWDYCHMQLPANWVEEQRHWLEAALYHGDGHLNVVSLAKVLWGHKHRAITSPIHVLGLGGENWRGYYWSGELLHLGKAAITNYDYPLSKLIYPAPPLIFQQNRGPEIRAALLDYFKGIASKYADFPNTVQLDSLYLFHRHPTHSGAFLSAAAGMARDVIPLCFKGPTNMAFSLNYRWKLPNSYRFIRTLLETMNPALANLITTNGGPAAPMRLTNLPSFWPLWKSMTNRATRKLSQRFLKKSITLWPEKSHESGYPLPSWRSGWLRFAADTELLQPDQMHSGALYNPATLQTIVAQAEAENFKDEEFLGKVITVEMALRAVGTHLN